MIADAQVHVWERVQPGRRPQRQRPFSPEELLAAMNVAGVDRAILVPPSWCDDGNEVVLRATNEHSDRFAAMGKISLDSALPGDLGNWKKAAGLVGLRLVFNSAALATRLHTGDLDWLWSEAEREQIPIMIHAAGSLGAVGRVARRFPALRLIIDHLGLPSGVQGNHVQPHITALLELATLDNIAVKATAVPAYSSDAFPFADMQRHVCNVIDGFGAERVFWGSDLTRLRCDYRDVVSFITEAIDCLTVAQRDLVKGRALCAWLGWS